MRKNEKGFSIVEILLIVVVVGLIVAVGWLFFEKQKDASTGENAATNSQQTEKAQDAQKIEDKSQYTLDNAITDINKVLASSGCSGKGGVQVEKADFVQVDNSAQFNYQGGKSLINNELTYAYTQYGCGTSGSVGLLKKADTGWTLVSEDARTYPMCATVRGQGFPTAIIDKCYPNDSSTEPVAI